MIAKGQHVKLLLTNNNLIAGIVEEWQSSLIKLKSLDGKSILIIHHPDRDIVLTKVMLDENVTAEIAAPSKLNEIKSENIKIDSDDVTDELPKMSPENMKIQNLANLRIEMLRQEKQNISEKLNNTHVINENAKKVGNQYEYPGFFKKPQSE